MWYLWKHGYHWYEIKDTQCFFNFYQYWDRDTERERVREYYDWSKLLDESTSTRSEWSDSSLGKMLYEDSLTTMMVNSIDVDQGIWGTNSSLTDEYQMSDPNLKWLKNIIQGNKRSQSKYSRTSELCPSFQWIIVLVKIIYNTEFFPIQLYRKFPLSCELLVVKSTFSSEKYF